ncbi:hypothetical protein ASF30_20580 [Leifsonia sp. Leaf264]|nr:hypothetical protein ASF30_20580 [Leifsonia sp. Leaf264]
MAQIVTVGRLGIQKDPGYFLSVVTEMRRQREISATWIGGGDAAWEEELIAAGVRVTGWVDSPLVQEHLSRADLYVHSAQWEGFPIAIIDAAHTRTPAVCRRVSTLDFLDPELTAESPFDLAQLALSTLSDATANLNAWAATCRTQNAKYQREGLLEAYNVGKPHA